MFIGETRNCSWPNTFFILTNLHLLRFKSNIKFRIETRITIVPYIYIYIIADFF